ncbi:MAG TPA: alkaline phosphatase family protein [Ilumatobacteraceae bacterium]|nr:alkaline phosphatase family protein [Ilumatobacteraceae bacterium]
MTQLAGRLRVVMVVIDAMPHRHVGPASTPNLWRQAVGGGRAPMGALSLPVSVTYSNHAAFVTGVDPVVTGVHGNHTWSADGWMPSPKSGPGAMTLFERVGAAGGRSAIVAGDQKLIGQMGGSQADAVWPPGGRLPDGTERCAFGYASDAAVLSVLDDLDLEVDFAVIHLNEPDTTSHLHGPDSPEAIEQYRATDAAYGEVIAHLGDGWDHTMVLTVSDHDQETITDFTPVELSGALADIDGLEVADEGTAALVHRSDGVIDDDRLFELIRSVDGVESASALTPNVWMAWTEPGRSFGSPPIPIHGQHGSPRCRTQMAIVSGGDPRVAPVARQIERTQPSVLDWAPMIARLLRLEGVPA